jgi:adenosylcobinamide kinase / adenosylcobinamide-phosphate guanylyltransferase
MIIFITGGARSGKSSYAQKRAKALAHNPVYVATARHWDEDFGERIRKHQQNRGSEWQNYEVEKHISKLFLTGRVVVIDCVTLWLTNFFIDSKQNMGVALYEFTKEIDLISKINATFIIVSNEIGMGVHAETEVGRKFVDLQGWANQYVAERASEVYLMVAGIPWKVKPGTGC